MRDLHRVNLHAKGETGKFDTYYVLMFVNM